MPQNLGGITKPFTVLSLAWLIGIYLSGGDEVCEPLFTADNVHGILLSESKVRHYGENILQ